jgi:hypothetical protein
LVFPVLSGLFKSHCQVTPVSDPYPWKTDKIMFLKNGWEPMPCE